MEEARQAMENATWMLLRQEKWAPIILATLTTVFDQGQRQMPSEDFHHRVMRTFDSLREVDHEFPVARDDLKAVRERCKAWVESGWLLRNPEGSGEVYRLSAEATEAIRIVQTFAGTRAAMSESQAQVVLERAQRLALKATSDPDTRMEGLRDRIAELEHQLAMHREELARLEAGGMVDLADDEEVHNEFLLLREEIDRLPSDLKRVEDSFHELAQRLIDAFISETRPHGEVVGEYLERAKNLAQEDRFGRGFQQAKRLLTDPLWRRQLQSDIDTILSHPFAENHLSERARADLRGTVHLIGASVSGVIHERQTMTQRLTSFVTSRDSLRERELDEALRKARAALWSWAQGKGPNARLRLPVGHHADQADDSDAPARAAGEVGVANISMLRLRPTQRRQQTPLKSLEECSGEGPGTFSVEELRAVGGPFYIELAAAIEAATAGGMAVASAQLFNGLPRDLRRPVDLLGLLTLATEQGALHPDYAVEEYHTIRPDGSAVTYLGPALNLVSTARTTTQETHR